MGAPIHKKVLEFLAQLKKADCVDADSPLLSSWDVFEPTGDSDNIVASFSWEDQDGKYSADFTEGELSKGKWVNTSFFCKDAEGNDVQITCYKNLPLVGPYEGKALTAAELAEAHGGVWGEHPDHSVDDWKYQIANGDARSGYWDWVASEIEQAKEKDQSASVSP